MQVIAGQILYPKSQHALCCICADNATEWS